jgi:CelD/BcsL family acetyltransferase involved in cellulose biosynthesis
MERRSAGDTHPAIRRSRIHAAEAIVAVGRLRDHVSPHLMITELRTIDEDELRMSPS